MMNSVRHLMVMHSVYEHLDKTICTAQVKNMVVHNPHAEAVLRERGHRNNVHYIPHGCFEFGDVKELWNIFRTPYVVMQFGFGFYYKGVDRALEAMALEAVMAGEAVMALEASMVTWSFVWSRYSMPRS